MEKQLSRSKKLKSVTEEQLLKLDKKELVDRILQLEAHNLQLKNIITKNMSNDSKMKSLGDLKKKFDFEKCHYRRVLLHISYFGWDYQGLAVQEDSMQTIEHYLFHALKKSCLIENRESSQYHRCGRTDKGVSAFRQVISISLRSKHPPDQQHLETSIASEISYCKILNRLLPKDIRAIAWMPISSVNADYSARFDCKKRKYKYYFPRSSLDITAMKTACQNILGSNDYRHLCKMDVGNGVTEFRREIFKADIVPVIATDFEHSTSMYSLVIEGNAFLWHQIRCIMGVLLLVGQGKETPEVITELLDVEKNPRKPQYNMALDIPLNLFHCKYDLEEINQWIYDKDELCSVITHLQGEWTIHNVKATMIRDCLQELEKTYARLYEKNSDSKNDSLMFHSDCLLQGVKPKIYKPLLKREMCSSLEERIEFYKKKRKIAEVIKETEKHQETQEL